MACFSAKDLNERCFEHPQRSTSFWPYQYNTRASSHNQTIYPGPVLRLLSRSEDDTEKMQRQIKITTSANNQHSIQQRLSAGPMVPRRGRHEAMHSQPCTTSHAQYCTTALEPRSLISKANSQARSSNFDQRRKKNWSTMRGDLLEISSCSSQLAHASERLTQNDSTAVAPFDLER